MKTIKKTLVFSLMALIAAGMIACKQQEEAAVAPMEEAAPVVEETAPMMEEAAPAVEEAAPVAEEGAAAPAAQQ